MSYTHTRSLGVFLLILSFLGNYAADRSADCFQCDDVCIPEEWLCNGIKDCVRNEDEAFCPTCKTSAFKCQHRDICISMNKVCDGIIDCPDESDEGVGCGRTYDSDSGSSTIFGLNIGVFVGALLAIFAVVMVILGKIILCIYRNKVCDDCFHRCRRDEEEDEEERLDERQFTDNPPQYSSCVNQAFVPDSHTETQATIKDLPPSYSAVLSGEFIIMHPGQLSCLNAPEPSVVREEVSSPANSRQEGISINISSHPVISAPPDVLLGSETESRQQERQQQNQQQVEVPIEGSSGTDVPVSTVSAQLSNQQQQASTVNHPLSENTSRI